MMAIRIREENRSKKDWRKKPEEHLKGQSTKKISHRRHQREQIDPENSKWRTILTFNTEIVVFWKIFASRTCKSKI